MSRRNRAIRRTLADHVAGRAGEAVIPNATGLRVVYVPPPSTYVTPTIDAEHRATPSHGAPTACSDGSVRDTLRDSLARPRHG